MTIRNLDDAVKQKLREQAARNRRSMEAEARELLARALNQGEWIQPPRNAEELRERLEAVRGIWKERGRGRATDEIMKEIRGDE